jgi:hypothetical protein
MIIRFFIAALVLASVSCTHGDSVMAEGDDRLGGGDGSQAGSPPKADRAQMTDVDWANSFFLTQIYDPRWNPTGTETDTESNNCGPASLAMVMAQRGVGPEGLDPATAMDHARAMMYAAYPDIESDDLPEGASLYVDNKQACVSDDGRPVYFDELANEPSMAQGILNGGARPEFGYSWEELHTLLDAHEGVIAYGRITEDWRRRFPGQYGAFASGSIPHFIAVFLASTTGDFVVCDPMHLGGAVVMTKSELRTFFKSPVNVFETSLRVIAWTGASALDEGGSTESDPTGHAREP